MGGGACTWESNVNADEKVMIAANLNFVVIGLQEKPRRGWRCAEIMEYVRSYDFQYEKLSK
jgi:hypothetical protein